MAITRGFRTDSSGVFITMTWAHVLAHKGEVFEVNDYDVDVDIAGPKYWHFKTADDDENAVHFRYDVTCNGGAMIEVFEDSTLSNDGTSLTIFNMNRQSTKTSSLLTAYYDPAVSSDGTRLTVHEIGSTGGGSRFAGTVPGFLGALEFILKSNTSYLIKVTVRQDDSTVGMNVFFYKYNYTDLTS